MLVPFVVHWFTYYSFYDTATDHIYTLSLHDALPIFAGDEIFRQRHDAGVFGAPLARDRHPHAGCPEHSRSEEHTSELQSLAYLVCRLLLEKKKKNKRLSCRHHKVAWITN